MKKKLVILFEILLIVAGFVYYTFWVMIPEYKASLGSSDGFINGKKYYNMIEVIIDDKTDFAFIVDSDGNINHLFFFDTSSLCLYNRDIENKTLEKGLKKSLLILEEAGLIRDGSNCLIYRNNDYYYESFKNSWDAITQFDGVNTNDTYEVIKLDERAQVFGVYDVENTSTILLNLDFYSKDIISNYSK